MFKSMPSYFVKSQTKKFKNYLSFKKQKQKTKNKTLGKENREKKKKKKNL